MGAARGGSNTWKAASTFRGIHGKVTDALAQAASTGAELDRRRDLHRVWVEQLRELESSLGLKGAPPGADPPLEPATAIARLRSLKTELEAFDMVVAQAPSLRRAVEVLERLGRHPTWRKATNEELAAIDNGLRQPGKVAWPKHHQEVKARWGHLAQAVGYRSIGDKYRKVRNEVEALEAEMAQLRSRAWRLSLRALVPVVLVGGAAFVGLSLLAVPAAMLSVILLGVLLGVAALAYAFLGLLVVLRWRLAWAPTAGLRERCDEVIVSNTRLAKTVSTFQALIDADVLKDRLDPECTRDVLGGALEQRARAVAVQARHGAFRRRTKWIGFAGVVVVAGLLCGGVAATGGGWTLYYETIGRTDKGTAKPRPSPAAKPTPRRSPGGGGRWKPRPRPGRGR